MPGGASCLVSSSAPESGTLTAYMNLYSDARTPQQFHDFGEVGHLRLELTLMPNPEPGTALLLGGALIGLGVIGRKRGISKTSRGRGSFIG